MELASNESSSWMYWPTAMINHSLYRPNDSKGSSLSGSHLGYVQAKGKSNTIYWDAFNWMVIERSIGKVNVDFVVLIMEIL
jgi:hypothetical protein